jgi:hypothetical protein
MFEFLFLGLFLSFWQPVNTLESHLDQTSTHGPFEAVPTEARTEVKASVDLVVKLYKQRQWGKIYDLMGQPPMPRDNYLQDASHAWTLIDFIPTAVEKRSEKNTDWVVTGCAFVRVDERREEWGAFILINLKESEKRIRLLIGLKKSGGYAPCEHRSANKG